MQRPILASDSTFALAHPRIIHESVEAEDALLIDLDRGTYYNLQGVAATIWKSAVAGFPLESIAAAVERTHSGCDAQLPAAVAGFVQTLIDEGLLTQALSPLDGARRQNPTNPPVGRPGHGTGSASLWRAGDEKAGSAEPRPPLAGANGDAAASARADCRKTPYRAPTLERHTDLEELLRADPICEVPDPNA